MKNFFVLVVTFLMVTLLAGCGSTKFLVHAPNGDAITHVSPDNAPKQNVKLVLIQTKNNFIFNADQKDAIAQLKGLVDATNRFGTVTVDAATFYPNATDVPKPAQGELVMGMTLSMGYKPYFFATLGKTLLNIATLTLSSAVLPYTEDHSAHITLAVIGEDGPMATYAAEAVGQAVWTPWTFQMAASRNSRKAIRVDAMTSVVNQAVSTPTKI